MIVGIDTSSETLSILQGLLNLATFNSFMYAFGSMHGQLGRKITKKYELAFQKTTCKQLIGSFEV